MSDKNNFEDSNNQNENSYNNLNKINENNENVNNQNMFSYFYQFIILDESQVIKNPSSKIYQAIMEVLSLREILKSLKI